MEKCPYKNHDWKQNIPAHILLVLIIAAIALLYYLYFSQEQKQMNHEFRIYNFERSLDFDYKGDKL